MAQFVIKDPGVGFGLGFDAGEAGGVPWQMVPLYGARGMELLHGPGLELFVRSDISQAPSDGLTCNEVGNNQAIREIWLQGRRRGTYWVEARQPVSRVVQAWLQVDVFPERELKLAFYNTGQAHHWQVNKLVERANSILFPQANVKVTLFGEWGSQFGESVKLPPAVDLNDDAQARALREFGNTYSASAMVYLVNRIAGDKGTVTSGLTRGNQVLLDASLSVSETARLGRTLAHELGHVMSSERIQSHDPRSTDLMFWKAGGTALRRARIRQFH